VTSPNLPEYCNLATGDQVENWILTCLARDNIDVENSPTSITI
jgi:hypothetical protein